ncbi:MAG: FHA domain-containing protein [Deltaproteobacteria bacterium]|nr:FHA domain-containing protein [Deltaproteobacteria bacterium]
MEHGSLDSLFADGKADPDTGSDLEQAALHLRTNPTTGDPVEATGPAHPVTEQARLEFVAPDGTAHTRILRETTTIGRHTDNDIQLLDPEVSKAHLVVRRMRDGYVLEDLGSANGTLINGMRQGRTRLADNDVVVVGNSVLRFRLEAVQPRAPTRVVAPEDPRAKRVASFQEARRSDPALNFRSGRSITTTPPKVLGSDHSSAERTTVTLVPEISNDEENSVFHQPVEPDFRPAESVKDAVELRRDYERLRVAYNISNAIGLETDLEALGQRIVEGIRDVLPADTIVVMLRDPALASKVAEQGELVTLASHADRGHDVRIPRAIVEQVVRQKRALLTSDAQRDLKLRRSETVVGQMIRSALCVPLVVHNDVLGVIHLSSSSAAGAYEEKDLALLRAIAQPAALAVANARLVRKVEEDAQQRAELSRFLSPALVEKVVSNELNVAKAGDKVQATVLFSDIRGFTTISDGAAPEAVVSMLNEYFEAMVEIVFEFGGTLDKFIGDGLMAVWGTPVPGPDDPVLAVRAATRMRLLLETVVNRARTGRGEPPLSAGYGIATGRVIAGAMGARRRQDFTVIGDTVNLASRLCGQARPGQILVDEATERVVRRTGTALQALEARVVKGVARPVPVWQVPREGGLDA